MTQNKIEIAKKAGRAETKRDRFVRVGEKRVNRILDSLDSLSKCSNRRSYEYSERDVKRMFRAIETKVKETKLMFQPAYKGNRRFRMDQ